MLPLDDDSTGQPHVDPDRRPTPLEVPISMTELVWGTPDTEESRTAMRAEMARGR